jgi:thiosulfate dehydrogenase [quinone] large subunit
MSNFEWNRDYLSTHKAKAAGVISVLIIRYLYMMIFIYGFFHKLVHGWMWNDIITQRFLTMYHTLQAAALHDDSLAARIAGLQAGYMQYFAIPLSMPIAWIVTIGELIVGLSMLLGIATRRNAVFGLFLLLNFAAGGYYNFTIPILVFMSLLIILLPTGQWLGLDKKLSRQHPQSPWFK